MISIIVYGRNDSYGYNLHKRAAISLNCMAEMLSDRHDEIIFVDYNTPDDLPTFPEAIRDTLTPHARGKIRILRVRPEQHARFRSKTHLVALEPISRNVAVRRSSPENRWILSTNTDIIFIPQQRTNLTKYAARLPEGIYHAPRLEIPEALWESLDRARPGNIISTVRTWGRTLHLDEVVYSNPNVLYDGPGDFQLIDREALFAVHGFHEEMLKGWHVDSNVAVRLAKYFGKVSDAGDTFFAYHCDHTRQITPLHGHNRVENDCRTFVDEVASPYLPEQADAWGLAGEKIDEVRLDDSSTGCYVGALTSAIGGKLAEPYRAWYTSARFDTAEYDPRHVLPFLTDVFSAAPKDFVVGWCGVEKATLEAFAKAWRLAGFTSPILVPLNGGLGAVEGVEAVGDEKFVAAPKTFIFDYGNPRTGEEATMRRGRRGLARQFLLTIMAEDARRKAGKPLRRFVGLNAINTSFEGFFTSLIGASATPFSSRMRHGFILPPDEELEDLMAKLSVGKGGRKSGSGIESLPDVDDWLCYGPYMAVLPGQYCLTFRLYHPDVSSADQSDGICRFIGLLDVSARQNVAYMQNLRADGGGSTDYAFEIEFGEDLSADPRAQFEFRIRRASTVPITLRDMKLRRVGDRQPGPSQFSTQAPNILEFLQPGGAGVWRDLAIVSRDSEVGHIGFGPYWRLLPREYVAEFAIEVGPVRPNSSARKPEFTVEVVQEGDSLLHKTLDAAALTGPQTVAERFLVQDDGKPVEYRVWTSGHAPLRWTGLRIREAN